MTAPTKLFALDQDALVEMYILDTTAIPGSTQGVLRFTQHDQFGQPITWQGQVYTPYPILASGFERRGTGNMARPKITVSNIGGLISAICRTTDDLIGCKVIRIRTFKKYLDAVNFPGGVNPTANPNVELPRETWRIDRRSAEVRQSVTFEMAAPWDVNGVMLPRRLVVQGSCMWRYRSSECGYAGGPVADWLDAPTSSSAVDMCSKRVTGCKLRFGETAELPFGGFPSVGQTTVNI